LKGENITKNNRGRMR